MEKHPHIAVLMTSYNHASYVEEQVRSIMAQSWDNWDLTISDNGSTDGSWEILKHLEDENPDRIKVVHGPGQWPDNHFSLVVNADPSADYFAWCDSDDVWLPNKLEMAMDKLLPFGQMEPALYCSRCVFTDERGQAQGQPHTPSRPLTFGNAFTECKTHGPTLAFNRPARVLIAAPFGTVPSLPVQDWWAYFTVTAANGHIIYDPRPTLCYRLHGGNIMGRKSGLAVRLFDIVRILAGHNPGKESRKNLVSALRASPGGIAPSNKAAFEAMAELSAGTGGLFHRLRLVSKAGLYRQSRLESPFLYMMAALGRL